MSNLISMDKRYRTRGGRDVRILCTDRDYPRFPVVFLLGGEVYSCTATGLHDDIKESQLDLIEVKPEYYVNIYRDLHGNLRAGEPLPTKELANERRSRMSDWAWIKVIKFTIED